ncbi:MAG: hypothetical protein SGPRY_013723, partial [Prymnesium sp.]
MSIWCAVLDVAEVMVKVPLEGPGQEFEPDNTAAIQEVLGEDVARSCGVSHRPGAVRENILINVNAGARPGDSDDEGAATMSGGQGPPHEDDRGTLSVQGEDAGPGPRRQFLQDEGASAIERMEGSHAGEEEGAHRQASPNGGGAFDHQLHDTKGQGVFGEAADDMNVVMMDENAEVTFGNKDYPAS